MIYKSIFPVMSMIQWSATQNIIYVISQTIFPATRLSRMVQKFAHTKQLQSRTTQKLNNM